MPKDGREKMGNAWILFLLSFSKIAMLYLLMQTTAPDPYRSDRYHIYEVVVCDMVTYIQNMRACLVRSYFSYCLTTLWLALQI